jgi:hypothetical protein
MRDYDPLYGFRQAEHLRLSWTLAAFRKCGAWGREGPLPLVEIHEDLRDLFGITAPSLAGSR